MSSANKWEYARLESTAQGVNVVFSHQPPWTGLPPEAFFETLRRLGDEGWELVAALPLGASAAFEGEPRPGRLPDGLRLRLEPDRWLVFKRPQTGEAEARSPQGDLVKSLVQRQILKGKLPL